MSNLNAVAGRITRLTNDFRKSEGVPTVVTNPELEATAEYFAKFMATNDKYGHTADGDSPSDRAKKHGYQFCIVSENLAYQYRPTGFTADELAQGFVEGWKNSSEHRENMLDPDVRETGAAVAHSAGSGHYYAVQMFGRSKADAIHFQIANRSDKTVHYHIGKKSFVLEPRYTRTHELCRPSELVFHGTKSSHEKDTVLHPRDGDAFVVVEDPERGVQIKRENAEP